LFDAGTDDGRTEKLSGTLDTIVAKWGRESLVYASSGTVRAWGMKQERLTRHYTTDWDDLLVVKV
jgi:DNA polymerase V